MKTIWALTCVCFKTYCGSLSLSLGFLLVLSQEAATLTAGLMSVSSPSMQKGHSCWGNSIILWFKNWILRVGQVAQELRAHTALAEDLDWVPSTHVGWATMHICDSSSRRSSAVTMGTCSRWMLPPPHADWNNNSNGRFSSLLFALLLDLYIVVIKLSGKMLRGVCMHVWYMYVKVLDTFFFLKIQFVGTGVPQHVLRSEDNLRELLFSFQWPYGFQMLAGLVAGTFTEPSHPP